MACWRLGSSTTNPILRPGQRVTLFHALKHMTLNALTIAGGDGVIVIESEAARQVASAIFVRGRLAVTNCTFEGLNRRF